MRKKLYTLDAQHVATIRAALMFYNDKGQGDPANRSDWVHDLATDGDNQTSMDEQGINELYQYFTLGGVPVIEELDF